MLAIYLVLVTLALVGLLGGTTVYVLVTLGALAGALDAPRVAQWFALATSGILMALVAFIGAIATRPHG